MKIIPKETQLREMDAAEVARMLQGAGAPEGTKRYTFGKAEVLLVPPDGTRGWWLSMFRPDREIAMEELIGVGNKLTPRGVRMSGRIDHDRKADGNYHAVMYEEVVKNGDAPYLEVIK